MYETEYFNAVIGLIFFASIPLTLLLSFVIRKRYRRGIVRAMMQASVAKETDFPVPAAARPNSTAVDFDMAETGLGRSVRPWLGARYLAAGLAYAVVLTVLMFLIEGIAFLPVRTTVVILSFATAAVMMGLLAAGLRWFWVLLFFVFWVWALYQIAPESNNIIALLAMPGMAVALILANPFMRTTTVPIYLISVAVLIPLLFILDVMLAVLVSGPFDPLFAWLPPSAIMALNAGVTLVLLLGLGIVFGLLVVRFVGWLTEGSSEFMMQNDALWMFQTIWMIGLGWGINGPIVLIYLLAFVAYRLVLRLLGGAPAGQPELLLLLRVFGNRGSQQTLSRGILTDWRKRGPVMLIGADDLATETLDAWELAAFLNRRLDRLFVNTPDDLERALARADTRLGDGLYPMQDYYCRDNSWRPTIKTLISKAGRVLLDLRGFSKDNLGVQFEIEQLAERVRSDALTVLYDETTDIALAQDLFRKAWGVAGAGGGPDQITFQRV